MKRVRRFTLLNRVPVRSRACEFVVEIFCLPLYRLIDAAVVSRKLLFMALKAVSMRTCVCSAGEEGSPLLAPTKDMAKLWGRVRQLRAYLRTQRQGYKVRASSTHLQYIISRQHAVVVIQDMHTIEANY